VPSQMYLDLLEEAADLHRRKSAGYVGAENPDPWANFRRSEKLGVPAWRGALIRASDKWERIINLANNPENDQVGESLEDTLFDLAAYALIIVCLRRGDGPADTSPETAGPSEAPHDSARSALQRVEQAAAAPQEARALLASEARKPSGFALWIDDDPLPAEGVAEPEGTAI
jgi:hypothetical protein